MRDGAAISVLVPFRDAAGTVASAARGVLGSPLVRELLAIDDGSLDGGAARVRELADRDPRVRVVESHGVGVARALALGVSLARHALLGRMDADDLSLPGRFEASAALLASDPGLGAVGTQVAVESETPAPGLEAYVAWQNGLVTREEHAAARFIEAPLCHPSTLLRRDALAQVGGYREPGAAGADHDWAEDYDLWLRLAEAGFGLAKVPRVLLSWRHHAGRATFRDARCSERALLLARAHYLARHLDEHLGPLAPGLESGQSRRPLAIWGAGKTGRRLGRALAERGLAADLWIDLDPAKIGRSLQNAPIVAPEALPFDAFVLVALRGRGAFALSERERRTTSAGAAGAAGVGGYARDIVRARLTAGGRLEGADFLCAG